MLNGQPIMQWLICSFILLQSLVKANKTSFVRQIRIAAVIPFIQHYFGNFSSPCFQLRQKYKSNKHLIQLFIFIFASKPFCVSLQSHPQDTLCTSFQTKQRIQLFPLKFSQKINIGLEFQKINLRIKISILEILCVCMCVCVCVCVCVYAYFEANQVALTFSD